MKLFSLQSTQDFGRSVAGELGISLSKHEEEEFEDGEHKSRPLENVRNEDVFVIQSLYADAHQSVNDKLCRLLFFIGALKDASAKRVTAVVPYLCYARKDQKTGFRDPVTTRYIAALFEAVGTDHLLTMDVHNVAAFQNAFRIPTENLEAKKIFADHLYSIIPDGDVVVLSPDIGGAKRAEKFQKSLSKKLQKDIAIAFIEKYRKGGVLSGEAVVGEVKGKTVIIIDDMISTGTTIARAATACKKEGASAIWVLVTHGIFAGRANEILDTDFLQQIIIANTIPPFRLDNTPLRQKITTVNAAPLFAEAIKRMHEGGAVTELLQD